MADQLTITNQTTGLATVVAVRLNADLQWWNTSGTPAFEAYNAANIANYGIAMSEVGATGVYTVDDPAPTVEGSFIVAIRAGAGLAVSDLLTAVGRGVAGPVTASEVLGAVGSVTGAVGSVTGSVTVGTNNDKTGYSLTATTGLGNQTADITGSLSGSVGNVTGNVGGNVVGTVASVVGAVGSVTGTVGGIAGTIQTLDALDAAQDTQHATTQTYLTNNLGAAGAAATEAGGTGDHLTALATATELAKVPKSDGTTSWNATALAAINAEVDTAIADYDPPTNAEMVARTLVAANYFDPAADTVANVTTTGTVTDKAGYSLSSAGIQAIWDALTSALTTVGSIGKLIVDNLNATVSSRSIHSAADVVTALGTGSSLTSLATSAAQTTAQNDLDILTGTDGVTLATSQPNYTPATAAALATVDTVVDGIKAVTDLLLTATGTIDNSLADATTTVFKTDLVAVNDFYNDQQLLITSGALAGQVKPISDFAQANGVITLAEGLTTAPNNGVTFAVLAIHVHSVSQIQSGLATSTALQTVDNEVGAIATSINSGSVVVASVTGAVGSVTDPVTAGTVTDKTGYSLDSNQMFNNTGTFTGDINGSVTGTVDGVTSGVTLAASQPLFTPAVAGDAMALTSGERTTLAAAIWSASTIRVKKNTALAGFSFPMVDTNDTLLTGLTVTATRTLDGGALASTTNAVTEIGSGFYTVDLAAADLNANNVALKFSATGAKDTIFVLVTQP